MDDVFYDSYAIIEFLKGNPRYLPYFERPVGVTTKLDLMEVYYSILPDEVLADETYSSFLSTVIDPTDEEIRAAMRTRRSLKERGLNVSYVDSLGYQVSRSRNKRFLTGDREFEHLSGVEFVK